MPNIDLNPLEGETLTDQLYSYIELYAKFDNGYRLTMPLVVSAESQRGESCKLKALADSMLQIARKTKVTLPPLYKNRHPDMISLRRLAKENGSMVGEVYSLEMLLNVCNQAGFAAEFFTPSNEKQYIEKLLELVNKRFAPIVFFDVALSLTDREGLPQRGDGTNEHAAAVVVGYYFNKRDEAHFIICQWGKYYDFDGMELALSSLLSLSDRRQVETFQKVRLTATGITQWRPSSKILPEYFETLEHVPERTAKEMKDTDTPLKGKIFVVTQKLTPIIAPDAPHFFSVPSVLEAAASVAAAALSTIELSSW